MALCGSKSLQIVMNNIFATYVFDICQKYRDKTWW
jgi:hypothetical protein